MADHGLAPGKRHIIKDGSAPVVTAREQYYVSAENRNRQMDPLVAHVGKQVAVQASATR
jgi:hypothetical protein